MLEHHEPPQRVETYYWRLDGARGGPTLCVLAAPETVEDLVSRFSRMPSLVYMSGTLVVSSERPADADDLLDLGSKNASDVYWLILARAATLGMISGRGVPASGLAT